MLRELSQEEYERKYGKRPSVIMIFNPQRSESQVTPPKASQEEEPLVSTTRLYEKISSKVTDQVTQEQETTTATEVESKG